MRRTQVMVRDASLAEFQQDVSPKDGRVVNRVWRGWADYIGRPQYIYRTLARRRWRLACGCWDGPLARAEARIRTYWRGSQHTAYRNLKLAVCAALVEKAREITRQERDEERARRYVDRFLDRTLRRIGRSTTRKERRVAMSPLLGMGYGMGAGKLARCMKAAR